MNEYSETENILNETKDLQREIDNLKGQILYAISIGRTEVRTNYNHLEYFMKKGYEVSLNTSDVSFNCGFDYNIISWKNTGEEK